MSDSAVAARGWRTTHGSSCRQTECIRRSTPRWQEHARQLCMVQRPSAPPTDKSEAVASGSAHAHNNSPSDGLFTSASCVSVTTLSLVRAHALVCVRVFSMHGMQPAAGMC